MNKLGHIVLSSAFFLLLVSISITFTGYREHIYAEKAVNSVKDNIRFYACGQYASQFVHCDPSINKRQSYELKAGKIIQLHNITNDNPTYVNSNHGKALEMHAYNKEPVRFTNTSNINPKQFSVSFWIKTFTGDDFRYGKIISHSDTVGDKGWYFDVQNSLENFTQDVSFNVYNDRREIFTVSHISIEPGPFVHIAGTFDGAHLRIFKDGLLYKESKFDGNYNVYPIVPLTVGMGSDCSCAMWSGIIDELSLYNRALKAGEINQIFKNNTPKAVSNALVGYWPLDGNLNDISGNNHNGLQYTILGSMVSAPDGRLFFDEVNTGKIKIMKDDKVLTKPFATISDYHTGWEQGLLGLALDPKFDQNRFVYLYYTSKDSSTGEPFNRVVRFTDNDNIGTNMVVILDRIPATKLGYHNGGAMAFGPDDKLYITVGDAYNDVTAQDTSALTGKVLRINRDGSIPQDNPYMTPMPSLIPFNGLVAFFNSLSCYITSCHTPVYNIGHRNMYGIAFDNNGFGIVTEAGDTNYDKINDIKKGGNYGWPTMQPANLPPELSNNSSIKPLRTYFEGITPTQAIYYDKDKIRQLNGKFLFGTYRGDIYALKIDKQTNEVIEEEKIRLLHYPENRIAVPVIGIAESRDGSVYYGAYSIYKLESVDASNKKQYIFPVEVNSKDSMIRGLQIDLDKKAMVLDVHAYSNNDNYLSPSVSVKIPKRILDGIFEVSSTNIEQKTRLENVARQNAVVNYAIDEFTSPDYTIINIRLKSDVDSKLSINGTSAIS